MHTFFFHEKRKSDLKFVVSFIKFVQFIKKYKHSNSLYQTALTADGIFKFLSFLNDEECVIVIFYTPDKRTSALRFK